MSVQSTTSTQNARTQNMKVINLKQYLLVQKNRVWVCLWLSGRIIHGTNPGPRQYLSSEESELAAFLVDHGPPVNVSGPLASSLSCPPMDVSGPLASSPSGPLMCSTCPPMRDSSSLMSLSGPPTSSPSGLSMNVSGPLVNSPSALNVSSALGSSSSGPQQLVHIPLSPHLSSNCIPGTVLPYQIYLIYRQSEIPGRLVKQGFLKVLNVCRH